MTSNIYRGERRRKGCYVTVNGGKLKKRLDLLTYRPEGFEWGSRGRGPNLLAVSILAREFDDETAGKFYKQFMVECLVSLGPCWTVGSVFLQEWMIRAQSRATLAAAELPHVAANLARKKGGRADEG